MTKDDYLPNGKVEEPEPSSEEGQSLLSQSPPHEIESGLTSPIGPFPTSTIRTSRTRHSSLAQVRPLGEPRTPNRVRFDPDLIANGGPEENSEWLDDEDYAPGQNAPLLTEITPPCDSPFRSEAFQPEDHLPDARPKSGMWSAFMNMANSIIGAGIIGQPYAFKQAGLTMGIILLVGLTVTVDWTIRLIVINSKLSGADSFQATMQHCFGRTGLIAISVAQWAFAFGGMIAFCIIVGDTIPHVMEALIPGLNDMPFLWLLMDRRAVIVLFILGISLPLSLYRDIAKVQKRSRSELC
jgi:solute carrier family 38 (sodium-coupled neutral amino acid transporter), member 11